MSFHLTRNQVLNRTKTVTRRLGWKHAKPGMRVLAVAKARGVAVKDRWTLATLEIVDVVREPLCAIPHQDVAAEGYPGWDVLQFVRHFCRHMRCEPTQEVTRIEFKYVDPAPKTLPDGVFELPKRMLR